MLLQPVASFAGSTKNSPSYLLVEITKGTHSTIAESGADQTAPVGSLLKPFAAWYLLERGLDAGQTIFCPAEQKRTADLRCWTNAGHGATDLADALVQSCNYFFLSLFRGQSIAAFETWMRDRFSWPENLRIKKPVHVYGYDLSSGISASKLVGMYVRLQNAAEANEPHAVQITTALAGTCRGTLKDFCRGLKQQNLYTFVWGKTGTVREGKHQYGSAALLLQNKMSGRKILLLCYERRKTGSEAAVAAVSILNKNRP